LPLVVIELKNPINENATLESAYQQLNTYKATIPSLFIYNELLIISDGLSAKVGSLSADFSRFMAWKTDDGKSKIPLETLINEMLNKQTLLDLIRHFIVFEKVKTEDNQKIISIQTVKKLAAYHQYYAVNKAISSTLQAAHAQGNKKAGVIWHTQGSGKSLSMVFYTGKIVLKLANPTVLIITDRNDLDNQLFDTFAACTDLLRQTPVQAENRNHLKDLLKVASGGVIFSTIQKFQPEQGNVYEQLSNRDNIVVIADEAHRTQYGFSAKTIDAKNPDGEVIGKKIVYGFAKYLRDALPNATYLGFTGTPIEKADANTPAVFGSYVDIYDINQSVEDGATVKIYYESRLAKVSLGSEGKQLIADWDNAANDDEETEQAKAKWTQLKTLIGSSQRIQNLAKDIVSHFEERQQVFSGKGMIVSMSRHIAVDLYTAIIKLKPDWHSEDLTKGTIKVVMTSASSDGAELAKHHTTTEERRFLAARLKDNNDPLKLVIVRDMWLTGFDAPCLHTIYIDKPMQGHNLMQAIARVNRVYSDKPAGLVVDYLGIASDLKKALSFYSQAGGKGEPTLDQEQAVETLLEKLDIIKAMFHHFDYSQFFSGSVQLKLSLLIDAIDYVLSLENGKKRFLTQLTALSKAFVISIPHEKAMSVKEEVAFFQAIKARLVKFDISEKHETNAGIETTIKGLINDALISQKIIDIFDIAGINKPNISILSDEFLAEVKAMQHKNVAIELLKKLLNDELRTRAKRNLVQSKSLLERLENIIYRYQNKLFTAVQVIDELIKLSKDIVSSDLEAKELGLTDFEYAFYTAVANNDSAKELMQKDKLRELATVLTEQVRKNATIDWTIKESARAKLKVMIKRTLRKYGYPPDMQALATETVLKQAEMIAGELTHQL
jgi:type I restriction enzyme, R subunit